MSTNDKIEGILQDFRDNLQPGDDVFHRDDDYSEQSNGRCTFCGNSVAQPGRFVIQIGSSSRGWREVVDLDTLFPLEDIEL